MFRLLMIVICLAGFIAPAAAKTPPLLVVENRSGSETLRLDRENLEQSPHVSELITATPWDDEPKRFKGIPLLRLPGMEEVASSDVLVLTALNDYTIELPPQWREHAFLAWAQDGVNLQPDDKGYFWVLFDFDSMSDADVKAVQSLSIWQLFRIEIRAR